jgi:NAD(P)-dependent dehydrogenase (short-subunit alcohol dehydrogenase family)
MRLAGKNAVIVGGGTAWGRDAAVKLGAEGAHILVLDVEQRKVDGTCAAVEKAGGRAEGRAVQIDDLDALRAVAEAWAGEGKPLHTLVTHFMATDWNTFEAIDLDKFTRDLVFNLAGPLAAVKAFLPLLKDAEGASIIHIGSVDGIYGNPRVPGYSTSKGGLSPMTHIMAHEFASFDIRVNAIAAAQTVQIPPSAIPKPDRPGWENFPGESYIQQLNDANPLKRYGNAGGWAGAIAFLASADADFITGATLVVDCGRTAITPGTA